MKRLILLLGIYLISHQLHSQSSSKFFFDEFGLSVNQTLIPGSGLEEGLGFGAGAYHTFRKEKRVNLMLGIEYNRLTQHAESAHDSHFSHFTDLTYSINYVSLPLSARINFGENTRFFLAAGAFLDLPVGGTKEGTLHTYGPNGSGENNYEKRFSVPTGYGVSLGLGVNIPVGSYNLIILPDIKKDLNPQESGDDHISNHYVRLNLRLKI